jgi:hypothetical protein
VAWQKIHAVPMSSCMGCGMHGGSHADVDSHVDRRYPKIVRDVIEDHPEYINGVEVPVDTSTPNPNGMEFDNLYLVSFCVQHGVMQNSVQQAGVCAACMQPGAMRVPTWGIAWHACHAEPACHDACLQLCSAAGPMPSVRGAVAAA